jgi:hypothetical protein
VQETSKAKGGVELLIDSTINQIEEMGNKGSKEGGRKTMAQDKNTHWEPPREDVKILG